MSSPILYGTAIVPLLRFPNGGRTKLRVVMDTDLDLHDDIADVVFAARGRHGIERTPMRFSKLGTPAAWEISAPNTITLTLEPDAADETEDSERTLSDLHEAAAAAWRMDFLDADELPLVRLQGDLEYLPAEGDWGDDPASQTTLPSVTVNLVNGAVTVSVSLITEGGGAITNATIVDAVDEDPAAVRTALELGTAAEEDSTAFAAASHSHAIGDVTGLQSALDGKAATSHSHAIGDVTGLQTALDGKAATSHSHAIGDVTGLQTALDGKAATSHTHTLAELGIGSSSTPTFAGLTLSSGSLTASAPVALSQTWNNAAITFAALRINITNTASATASLLMDLQTDGASRFRVARNGSPQVAGTTSFECYSSFGGTRTWLVFDGGGGNPSMQFSQGGSISFNNASDAGAGGVVMRYGGSVGTLQLGTLHATTPSAQVMQSHGVTTGTGASLTLQGGSGSVARGNVILNGGNRSAYIASPTTTQIRDILINHGLMAAS